MDGLATCVNMLSQLDIKNTLHPRSEFFFFLMFRPPPSFPLFPYPPLFRSPGGDCFLRRQPRLEQPLQQDVPDLAESQYRHTLFLHRRYSSSRVAASVFSSRYFTMTGAYSEMSHRAADAPGAPRAPGTTTAPGGISSGRSPSRRYT